MFTKGIIVAVFVYAAFTALEAFGLNSTDDITLSTECGLAVTLVGTGQVRYAIGEQGLAVTPHSIRYLDTQGKELRLQPAGKPHLHRISSSRVLVRGAFPRVDGTYTLTGSSIKEDLIVPESFRYDIPRGASRVIFQWSCVALGGASMKEHGSSVLVKDSDSGTLFAFAPALTVDSAGNAYIAPYSIDTDTLSIEVAASWLLSKERSWPIRIDPTCSCGTCGTLPSYQKCLRDNVGQGYGVYGKKIWLRWPEAGCLNTVTLKMDDLEGQSTSLYVKSYVLLSESWTEDSPPTACITYNTPNHTDLVEVTTTGCYTWDLGNNIACGDVTVVLVADGATTTSVGGSGSESWLGVSSGSENRKETNFRTANTDPPYAE